MAQEPQSTVGEAEQFAAKADIVRIENDIEWIKATLVRIEANMATKADIARIDATMATKADIAVVTAAAATANTSMIKWIVGCAVALAAAVIAASGLPELLSAPGTGEPFPQ